MPYSHPHPSSPGSPEYGVRKRVGKACDSCRIKKSKCDGRKPCSRCMMDDKICTFTERKKSKEKLYSSRYVELLENRIEILQNGMEELVKRVSRGDDISNLLSKSGHVSINRALDELTNKSFELQKEEHERIVDVHDDSEHDTDEHDHDNDHKELDNGIFDEKGINTYNPSEIEVETNFDSVSDQTTDPETIIRGHNHHAHESMSPDSMTSASSLYSSSASPTVAGINISLDTTRLALNGGDLDPISQPILSDFIHPMPQVGSTTDKVSGLSDIWLTSTFMEI
ncbi:uncharacterized protein V2V93DRAFT_390426 [Kockiozyma suomiensis]|uniref:uncharacterized protein n=1 Tax=Kockiozyma suomiensis TaxID=1337062 RepID=UPI003342F379